MILSTRSADSPSGEWEPFQKNKLRRYLLAYAELWLSGNGPEDSNAPFLYRCPVRAAFFRRPDGTVPTGVYQSESLSPACRLQNTIPRRAQIIWKDSKTVGKFTLGGVPVGKGKGASTRQPLSLPTVWGNPKGNLLVRGSGTDAPRKGVG